MNLPDNEIVQALEYCAKQGITSECEKCTVGNGCRSELIGSALSLINRQKAEIERLKQTPKCVYAYDGETMEYCVEGPCSAEKLIENIKSEARKEFVERLRAIAYVPISIDVCPVVDLEDIDNLVKELTEVSDNDKT